jgi:hypothetical protein
VLASRDRRHCETHHVRCSCAEPIPRTVPVRDGAGQEQFRAEADDGTRLPDRDQGSRAQGRGVHDLGDGGSAKWK